MAFVDRAKCVTHENHLRHSNHRNGNAKENVDQLHFAQRKGEDDRNLYHPAF